MSKTARNATPEENLKATAELFKALGHPIRLLILNLVQTKPRHGEELAAILNLHPATVSHHLAKLASAGLLKSEKDQYYQTYSLIRDVFDKTLGQVVHTPPSGPPAEEEDAYQTKVLKAFIKHGRLTRIPAQLKKRRIILEKIIQEFDPEREYTELEVNQILMEFHEDIVTLRRELVDGGLMDRMKGIYRRA